MVVGPLLATKHFQSNLEQSEAGKVVNLTSRLGSLGGGQISLTYPESKH